VLFLPGAFGWDSCLVRSRAAEVGASAVGCG
jgi:hypothetical protein